MSLRTIFKNPTPRQVAILTALSVSACSLLFCSLLFVWQSLHPNVWINTLIAAVGIFLITYLMTVYFLKKYIYRKIKLIYKTIHKRKLLPSEKKKSIDISSHIIDEMEKEVANWAVIQQREINKYKSWAEYRRNFVGDISHELKTPLFNIQGYLHTLLDGGLQDDNVNQKFLNKAVKNVARLQTIVEDMEAISKLESGKLVLEMRPFDLKELTMEVMEELEFKARAQNIRLQFKEGADKPVMVQADRESIRQVLTNLIDNSIKYGRHGGQTKVSFYHMDRNVLIEVADNGVGIPDHHLDHVFDRFYRVDKSRSRERGGSGLGLSIVKHIIEAHKQTINVRSTRELGSTFGFTLSKT